MSLNVASNFLKVGMQIRWGHIESHILESGSNSNLMMKIQNGILIYDLDGASLSFKVSRRSVICYDLSNTQL